MEPSIYLLFEAGDAWPAMSHYAKVLGGSIERLVRNSDAPSPADRMPGDDTMVMHMTVRIGHTLVMASDAPADRFNRPAGFSMSIAPESIAEFERVHAALAEGARQVMMPPGETFWAERFAMFTDRYGTPWMLSFAGSKTPGGG